MYSALRFLVADDNSSIRTIIKEILRGFGVAEIELANDGAAALQVLKSRAFDVLITDMVMPGVNVMDLVQTIRLGGVMAKADMPIILLSGNIDRATALAARNAGVSELVTKPIVVAQLHARLEACVRNPRPFVSTPAYTGPSRRRNSAPFPFADRRGSGDRR